MKTLGEGLFTPLRTARALDRKIVLNPENKIHYLVVVVINLDFLGIVKRFGLRD